VQRDSRDHARLLLSKTHADKLVVDKLIDDHEVPDDMIGFHAQQAVEKLIKAVLAHQDIEYPRVHDIDRLVDVLEAHQVALPRQARSLDELTPWATQLRYDESLDVEPLDRGAMATLLNDVARWADAEIGSAD